MWSPVIPNVGSKKQWISKQKKISKKSGLGNKHPQRLQKKRPIKFPISICDIQQLRFGYQKKKKKKALKNYERCKEQRRIMLKVNLADKIRIAVLRKRNRLTDTVVRIMIWWSRVDLSKGNLRQNGPMASKSGKSKLKRWLNDVNGITDRKCRRFARE